ncbi:MAG: hypothetical protein AB8E15_10180 [Bdellovibrionales bacterium]
MRRLLWFLAPLMFVVGLKAEVSETRFTVRVIDTYFSCDAVENATEKVVKALGGEIVKLRCNGGLPYFEDVRIRLSVAAPSIDSDNADWVEVNFKNNRRRENCGLYEEVMDGVLDVFTVRNLNKRANCWRNEGRLSYTMDVLNFQ